MKGESKFILCLSMLHLLNGVQAVLVIIRFFLGGKFHYKIYSIKTFGKGKEVSIKLTDFKFAFYQQF